MALQTLNFAGFESSHEHEVLVNAGTASVLTSPAPPQSNESYTMNLVGGATDAVIQLRPTFNFTTNRFVTMGCYLQIQNDTPVGDTLFMEFEGATRINMEFYYTSTGLIRVTDSNGTVIGTSTTALVAGTWYLFEFEWKADTAANGGAVQIYLDGTSILNLTSQDFEKDGQASSFIRFLGSRAGESLYIASFYMLSDATAYPTRYGPYEILTYAYDEAVATPNISGDALDASTTWDMSADKLGDDATTSRYNVSGRVGYVETSYGGNNYTAGPNGDSRVGTILAASWLFRLNIAGFSRAGKVYYGAGNGVAPTTNAAISAQAQLIFYDNAALMPTSTEYFSYGFEHTTGFWFDLKDVWCSLLHQPSSGAALVHVVDETVNLTDGKVAQRELVQQAASTVNVSDGSLHPMAMTRQVASTVQASDSQIASAAIVRVVSETVQISDTQSQARARVQVHIGALVLFDAKSSTVGLVRSAASTVNVADGTNSTISSALIQVVGETVNLTEQTGAHRRIVQGVASAIQVADDVSRRGLSVHSTGSTVAITDGQAFGLALVRVVSESVEVAESVPWVRGLSRETGETLNVADGTIRAVASAIVKVSGSTVNVSEGTLHPVASALLHIVNDAVSIAEAVNRRGAMVRAAASTVDITDATNTAIGLVRLAAASINLAELVNNRRALVRLTAAGINVGETTIATRGVVKIVSDAVNVSDGNLHLVTPAGSTLLHVVTDTLSLAEAVERHKAISQLIGESVNITDATNKAAAFVRSVSDSVNVSESVDRLGAMLRAVSSTINVADTVEHVRAITKLAASTLSITEQTNTQRGIVRITGSTLAIADAIARAAALVRMLDESVSVADAQLASRALRRIASEGVSIGEGLIFSGVFPFVTLNESVSLTEGVLHRLTERGHVNLEDLMADLHRTATIESDLDVEAVTRDIFSGLKM